MTKHEYYSSVDTFFSFHDAVTFIDGHLNDFDTDHYDVKELEIKLLPSGAYRAGVVIISKQQEESE